MLSKLMTWSKAITNAESRQHLGQYKDAIGLYNIALVMAQRHGTKEQEAETLFQLGTLHMDYKHYEEAVSCFEQGLTVVQETGDKEWKWKMNMGLATSKQQLGQYKEGIRYCNKALKIIAKINGSQQQEAETLYILGRLHMDNGHNEEAVSCFEKGLTVVQETGDKEWKWKMYMGLATSKKQLVQYKEGIQYCNKAVQIILHINGSQQQEAETLYLLGRLHMDNGHYEEAVSCFEKGLTVVQETGDKELKWKMYMGLALSKQQLGQYEEGIQNCNKALKIIAKINGSQQQEARTLCLLGKLHNKNKQYQEAVICFKKGLPIVQDTGDKESNWDMYMDLATSNANLSKYEQAIQYLYEALDIAQTNELKQEEIETLGLLGKIYNDNEQYQEAIDCYQIGLPLAQQTGDKKQEHTMCIGLGKAYRALGHCSDSMKYSEMALDIANDVGDLDMIANSYLNLGNTYSSKCDYQNSMIRYINAIDIFKQADNYSEKDLAQCYGGIALVYKQQGKYHDAIRFQEKCLKIAVDSNDKSLQSTTLNNLGSIHMNLNNFKKGSEFYSKSRAIAERISNKAIQIMCNTSLAHISSAPGNYQEADSMHQKSLEIAKELGDKKKEAEVISNIGYIYYLRNDYEEAFQRFYESLTILTKDINAKNVEATVYRGIGRIYHDTEKFEEAISMYEISLAIASSIGDKENQWLACYELGLTYYSLGHRHDHKELMYCLSKSEEYLRLAVSCHNFLFTHLRTRDQFKISKFDQFTETYNLLTRVLIEKKQTEEALLISDQKRACALTDLLKLQYGVSEDLSSKPLTYPDVESVVSNDAFTILHYSLLKKSLVVCTLSKDSIKFKELDKEEFDAAIESLYLKNIKAEYMQQEDGETCENRSLDDYMTLQDQQYDGETNESVTRASNSGSYLNMQALEVLYNTLIAPVISDVRHDEVVIVPDGKMYTVPFAALKDVNTGKYLSESKRIRHVPSIAVLKLLQECTVDNHSQQGALIVGNPIGIIVNVEEEEGIRVKLRGKKVFWKSLNHARKEALEIEKVFTERSGDVQPNITLLTETRATKDVVLEKMKEENGVIHIAAHGDADFGEILLAPIESQDRQGLPEEQDYLLTMTEVQEVSVKAQLVVLSCCHSGRGEIRTEGMIGLSRAFIAAGARAVVASLWDINSKATRKFMVRFYRHLRLGHTASVSLNKAMKYLRKEYSEPKYWAPFVLIGDDVTVKFGH